MVTLTPLEKHLIYHLSGDLGDSLNPYAQVATHVGMTEEEVLSTVRRFTDLGLIRRLGATLWHQRSGFIANAMVVFQVPEERLGQCGKKLASYSAVSHCYQRRPVPVWPYNLYAMVHAHNRDELLATIDGLVQATEAEIWRILESLHEFKKTSLRYFTHQAK